MLSTSVLTQKYWIPIFSVFVAASAVLIFSMYSSSVSQPPSDLLLLEIMLFSSLFTPGYLAQHVITNRLARIRLSYGERLGCSFGLSIFLIASISFITSVFGTGLREIFYGYFGVSQVALAIILILNRKWIVRGFSSLRNWSKSSSGNYLLYSMIFLIIPLFHFFGFAKINWDGLNFYLRDALAISVSNSISPYYPDSVYQGNIPLIFNSYLSSIVYSYGLNILGVFNFQGSVPVLMEYTNIALSFVVLATLFCTSILLGSFAYRLFKDKYLAAAAVVIFLTTPLLNQFLYVWSLYADLFFAFETLFVFSVAYRFLEDERRESRYFSILMLGIGLSLALVTKTYGYILLLALPLLLLKRISHDNRSLTGEEATSRLILVQHAEIAGTSDYEDSVGQNAGSTHNSRESPSIGPSKVLFVILLGITISFASFYVIRTTMLTGSPFGYTVQGLVNYTEDERWANGILNSSGILQSVENYPSINQMTSLLLSYGLFPVLMVPLLIGVPLAFKKDPKGLGIIAAYILCYFALFVTILELRVDRHLFSLSTLLPLVYVFGLKAVSRYLGWKRNGLVYMTIILSLFQIPLLDAIYLDFKVADIFPSMYYWYTNDNMLTIVAYSLVAFGTAAVITHGIVTFTAKKHLAPYVYGTLLGLMVVMIIVSPLTNVLSKYDSYREYLQSNYENYHLGYPVALQELLANENHDESGKLLYLHGLGTEFLTSGHGSYIKLDDFRMLASLREVIEEKDPHVVNELLASKNIKFILYPSENNVYYRKVVALSNATDEALIFSNPSSVTIKKIALNEWWDLYIV